MHHVMTATSYCWPVLDYEQLRFAAEGLVSREEVSDYVSEIPLFGIAHLVFQTLQNATTQSIITTDDTGHTILFIGLYPPLPQDCIKDKAKLEVRPLLLAVLLPELAFNIAEIADTYDFSVQSILEQEYGADISEHVIFHRGTIYLNIATTFRILNQEHPSILVALGFPFMFRGDRQPFQIRELIKDAIDVLQQLEVAMTEGAFEEIPIDSLEVLNQKCVEALAQCESSITGILVPEGVDESDVRRSLNEALVQLLADERLEFNSQLDRILPTIDYPDPDSMDFDMCSQDSLLAGLHRRFRLMRKVCHRLGIIRQTIPSE